MIAIKYIQYRTLALTGLPPAGQSASAPSGSRRFFCHFRALLLRNFFEVKCGIIFFRAFVEIHEDRERHIATSMSGVADRNVLYRSCTCSSFDQSTRRGAAHTKVMEQTTALDVIFTAHESSYERKMRYASMPSARVLRM